MGRVVTFYSYKGGVGRSFLLANVAATLAHWGYRVLCIDWDLEAPGLHHYFLPWIERDVPGIVDLVEAFAAKKAEKWVRHITRVTITPMKAKLDFMIAGRQDVDYFRRAQRIDWNTLYEEKGFGQYLESLRDGWKYIYDFVLIDSRTGISDLAGICTVHLPDLLLFVFTANNQSVDGATLSARRMVESRNSLPFDRERLQCLPVLSRFAMDKEYAMASTWLDRIEKATAPFFEEWLSRDLSVTSVLQQTRIPEIAYWTFGERMPVVEDANANSDPQSINYSLQNIAGLIARNLSSVQQLLVNRDSFLASAAKVEEIGVRGGGSANAGKLPVFISASSDDRQRAAEIADLLELHDVAVRSAQNISAGKDWRGGLLRELRAARYLIVLISDETNEGQNTEIESFFSLTVRTSENVGIIPVVLTDAGLKSMPRLLMHLQIVDGRDVTNEAIVQKCLTIIRTARGASESVSIQLV